MITLFGNNPYAFSLDLVDGISEAGAMDMDSIPGVLLFRDAQNEVDMLQVKDAFEIYIEQGHGEKDSKFILFIKPTEAMQLALKAAKVSIRFIE